MKDQKFEQFGKSANGNFEVIDSIGVPHPYCITPKHLQYADSMYLDKTSIERAESKGAQCDICKKNHMNLTYAQHEQALVVACYKDFNTSDELKEEIQTYLKGIVDLATKEHYAGFSFLDKFSTKGGE